MWGNKKIPQGGIYRWSISRILFRPGPVVSNHPRVASIINLRCVLPRTSSPLPVPWVGRPLGTYLIQSIRHCCSDRRVAPPGILAGMLSHAVRTFLRHLVRTWRGDGYALTICGGYGIMIFVFCNFIYLFRLQRIPRFS